MPVSRLVMTGVQKAFGPTVALAGVDLAVEPGEVHALVGENGAGKSTLMKVLAGAYRPDAGTLRLDGEPYQPAGPLDARRHGVAMVYQELSLVPRLTIAENILLGVEPSRFGLVRRREMVARARQVLAEIGHPDLDPDTQVGVLPLAAQQLVEIARAVAQTACRVLILDEPTSSLTRDDVDRLFGLIRRFRERGLSVIYISHVIEEVQRIADRLTVLRDGRSVGGGAMGDTTAAQIVALMAGRQVDHLFPRSPRASGAVALEVRNLAGLALPTSATLALRRGEVVGIAGLAGAGRTELLRVIFGLDAVRRGEIRVGAFVGARSPTVRLAQGVGLLSEDRKREALALPLSIADNLTLSKLRGLGPGIVVLPSRQRRASQAWIGNLAIRCRDTSQPVWQLSGGNQQKVALARLLYHDVDVLLLDEPTRGIDVASKAQIYDVVDRLAVAGKAVLVVSSYLPELLGICDRVAVMRRGVLGPLRPVGDLTEHAVLMEATGLA